MSQSKRGRKKARQARRGGPRPQPAPRVDPAVAEEPVVERQVQRPKSRMDRMLEKADARPKPPWHPVPLVEISVLVGIVLLVVGLLNRDDSTGRLAIGVGIVLASLAGLDTAAREHFAGYRSHSSLLAGLPALGTLIVLAVLQAVPLWLGLILAVAVFAGCLVLFRRAFRKRAGVAFKV